MSIFDTTTPAIRRALALSITLHNDYRLDPALKRVTVDLIRCIEHEMRIPEDKSAVEYEPVIKRCSVCGGEGEHDWEIHNAELRAIDDRG